MTIDAAAADSAALRYTKLTGTARETVRLEVQHRAAQAKARGETPTYTELLIAALDEVDRLRGGVAADVATVEELRAATDAAGRLGETPSAADLAAAGLDVSMPEGREQVGLALAMSDLDGVEEQDELEDVDRRPLHERAVPKETPDQLAPELK